VVLATRFPIPVLISKGKRAMPLYFKCKICGSEHPSPIVFPDEISFDHSTFESVVFRCPIRLETAAYHKEDMLWQARVTPFD
jgi:hypothetical protein